MKKSVIILILLSLILSCSEDEDITISLSDFQVTIDENPSPNHIIGIIDATTNQGNLTFSITEQSPNNAFRINASTGELIVLTESLFDFETYPIITGTVTAENGNVTRIANITINLNNVIEAPVISISNFEITIDENPNIGQIIGNMQASVTNGNLVFSITEQTQGNPYQHRGFDINSNTGELMVITDWVFDYETNPVITGIVYAETAYFSGITQEQYAEEYANVTINLNDIDETIFISDFELTIDENPFHNQLLGSIDAVSNEGNLTFSVTQQSPENAIQINSTTGELFVSDETLFNYEINPLITGIVEVVNGSVTENVNVNINLNDIGEIVTISSFELTMDENPNPNELLGTISATTDTGILTFSITEQSPNDAFQINPTTGELTVLNEDLFDFETYPTITGIVMADNGNVSDSNNIIINLNDLNDSFEITNIVDTNIEGLNNVPSYNTLPDINSENFQNSPLIITKSYETTHQGDIACFASRGLLNFDLTSIPSNINITNVQLVLHKDNVIYCPPCGPNDNQNTQLHFQLINSTWDVATVNWENQPSTDTNQSISLHILDIENVNNFNITNLFLELYNNQNIYEGLMLKMTESCIQESVSFFSSNYSDTSKRPKIIIQYN